MKKMSKMGHSMKHSSSMGVTHKKATGIVKSHVNKSTKMPSTPRLHASGRGY